MHAVRVGGVIEQLVNLQNLPQAVSSPHSRFTRAQARERFAAAQQRSVKRSGDAGAAMLMQIRSKRHLCFDICVHHAGAEARRPQAAAAAERGAGTAKRRRAADIGAECQQQAGAAAAQRAAGRDASNKLAPAAVRHGPVPRYGTGMASTGVRPRARRNLSGVTLLERPVNRSIASVCLVFINHPCPKMGAAASGSHEVVA